MKNKLLVLLILGLFLVGTLGFTSAANYKFQNTTGTNLMTIFGANGNVSILGNLSVAGILYGDGSGLTNINTSSLNLSQANYWNKSGSDLFYNAGNVGIGTASPGYKLDVNGSVNAVNANYQFGIILRGNTPSSTLSSNFGFIDANGQVITLRKDGTRLLFFNTSGIVTTSIGFNGANTYFNIDGGNVGIGTTAPGAKLDIYQGNITLSSGYNIFSSSSGIEFGDGTFGNEANDLTLYSAGGGELNFAHNGALVGAFQDTEFSVDTNLDVRDSSYNSVFYVNRTSKNVGIGMTGPTSLLEIKGTTDAILTLNSATDRDAQITFKENSIDKWYLYNDGNAGDILNLGKSTGGTVLTVNQDGNVGIGTTAPGAKLEVAGTTYLNVMPTYEQEGQIRIGRVDNNSIRYHLIKAYNEGIAGGQGNYLTFAVHNANTTTSTTDVMTLSGTGNVGIGTTAPTNKLNVIGDLNVTGTIYGASGGALVNGSGTTNYLAKFTAAGTVGDSGIYDNGTSGYVGIGTTTPIYKLDVSSNIRAGGLVMYGTSYTNTASEIFNQNAGGNINLYTYTASSVKNNGQLYLASTGNVGIGTTSPGAKLEVNGTIQSKIADGGSAFIAQNLTGTNRFAFNTLSGGGLRIYDYGGGAWNSGISQINGNVGIGITNPESKFVVNQSADSNGIRVYGYDDRAAEYGSLFIDSTGYFNIIPSNTRSLVLDTGGAIFFREGGIEVARVQASSIQVAPDKKVSFGGSGGSTPEMAIGYHSSTDTLQFVTNGTLGSNVRMVINATTGNVGIGTTAPTAKLNVVGEFNFSSSSVTTFTEGGALVVSG